uniref:VASt domain-containing protein n=1 Tax=Strongyloides venezuelensis TaxID=75913 RepID=A0A0K0F9H8_STRVS
MDMNCNLINSINSNLRRTSNQSLDSGVTDSNTTISDSTTSKKQQSSGFDYISKALMAVSSNALMEHQNFFKWNFCKEIPDKEYVLAAIPCYESEDTTRNGFLYITPKYLAYTSSHSQCYFLLTDIQKINKKQLEIDGNDFLEVILKNSTIYKFHGITDILSIYWLIYELKILKWDEYWINKIGITRRIKSSMKLKSYKNYFKVKESVKKFKSLNKLTRGDDIDSCALPNKTEDTLKATISSNSKKDQFLNGRTLQNNNKKSQIIKAYNSFTRRKQKIPFHDLNSVKTNESDQLSLSDLSSSIDREDISSATNSCTISTSSPSINDGEKCFDVSENDDDSTKILFPVTCGCTEHVGKKHIDSTYNIPLDIFFQILFSSVPWYEQLKSYIATSSKEMAFFEKMNKASAEEWKNIDKNNKIYYRDVKFTMSFSQAMFSGKINVKEEQTLSPINNNYECGGKLVKKVFNTGVPMADSFYIEVTYCLTRYSEFQTHLQVYGNVVLRKQKGFFASIKSNFPFDAISQSGLSDHYSSLNRLLSLFSADKMMYNNLLEILAKNNSDQGIPITFKAPFINSIESDEVFKSESKLNVSTFEKKVRSKIYNEKPIDVDILNQLNDIIGQSIIKNNINLCSNKMANTVDSLNLKLDSLAKQLKLLIIIFGLSLVCQVFYILHVYIFS